MTFKDIETFQNGLTKMGIAGNDLAIYLDGEEVYRYSTGWQNIEKQIPVNRNTLYKMFSMTKPITCAAAMQLFEKGKFLLNDDLSDYMPVFKDMMVKTANGVLKPAKTPIEIQHLFSMAAGMDYDLNATPLAELAKATDYQYTTLQFAEAIAKKPLNYEPGTHWAYSQAHDVLGALIEVLSGKTFGEYLKENIFEPLQMKSAAFIEPEEKQQDYMLRYGLDENGNYYLGSQVNQYQMSPNMESGGAGLSMTIDDYAKFACAMTNRGVAKDGTRILAGRTVDLMRENFLNPEQYMDIFNSNKGREGYGYGLGMRTMVDKAACGTLSPIHEFGWGGAWGTYLVLDPDNKVTIVYGEQAVDTHTIYIQRRLRNLTYAALEWEGLLK